ncbi:FixG Ig-like domain-containing protein, partial [Diaphorobacter sp.]
EGAQRYTISAHGMEGLEVASETAIDIGPAESRWVVVRLQIPYGSASPGSHTVYFDIQAQGDKAQVAEKSVFLVPR